MAVVTPHRIFRQDGIQKEKRVSPLRRKAIFPRNTQQTPSHFIDQSWGYRSTPKPVTAMGTAWWVKANWNLLTELSHVKQGGMLEQIQAFSGRCEWVLTVPLYTVHISTCFVQPILSPFCHMKPSLVFLFQTPLALSLILTT